MLKLGRIESGVARVQKHREDKNLYSAPDQLLRALARELKNPLILIARRSELEKNASNGPQAYETLQQTAENALQLIDSYMLMAQSEYGQRSLPLETVGIGSVVYEVVRDLTPHTKVREIDFATEVKAGDVMANREGLKAIIWCLCELMVAQNGDGGQIKKKVRIKTMKQDRKVSISVLSSDMDITNSDIDAARRIQGMSHLAGGKLSDSGIRLAIADVLTSSLGSRLKVRKINGLKGLCFELAGSRQLQLV
ncbi:MAG TPA: hypothetical protein VFX86_01430 [Candidatus Saccharimonadales bacterium]|nr:hypothetical protein [Candidatus Saccharimonadales bacterium]